MGSLGWALGRAGGAGCDGMGKQPEWAPGAPGAWPSWGRLVWLPTLYSNVFVCVGGSYLTRRPPCSPCAGAAKVVSFDKSGTLTTGSFRVVASAAVGHHSSLSSDLAAKPVPGTAVEKQQGAEQAAQLRRVMGLASALEVHSVHPVAAAIVGHAAAMGACGNGVEAEPGTVVSLPGEGVRGEVAGQEVVVGSARLARRLLLQQGGSGAGTAGAPAQGYGSSSEEGAASALAEVEAVEAEWGAQGASTCFILVGGQLAGWAAVADAPRPHAAEAVATLKRAGVGCAMLTGDSAAAAHAAGMALGLDPAHVHAELLPEGKVEVLGQYRAGGLRALQPLLLQKEDSASSAAVAAAAQLGDGITGDVEVGRASTAPAAFEARPAAAARYSAGGLSGGAAGHGVFTGSSHSSGGSHLPLPPSTLLPRSGGGARAPGAVLPQIPEVTGTGTGTGTAGGWAALPGAAAAGKRWSLSNLKQLLPGHSNAGLSGSQGGLAAPLPMPRLPCSASAAVAAGPGEGYYRLRGTCSQGGSRRFASILGANAGGAPGNSSSSSTGGSGAPRVHVPKAAGSRGVLAAWRRRMQQRRAAKGAKQVVVAHVGDGEWAPVRVWLG